MRKIVAVVVTAAWVVCGLLEAQTLPTSVPSSQPKSMPSVRSAGQGIDAKHLAMAQQDMAKGLRFVLENQLPDGGWGFDKAKSHPALTAMVLKALLQSGQDANSPAVAKGFVALMTFRQSDGGFYDPKEGNQNYNTSLVVMTLATARLPQYKDALDGAIGYLRGEQIVEGSKTPDGKPVTADNPWVGGVSYGNHGRPDLSNLGMWMDAMHDAGVSGDDPAMQRALGFVKRLQNRSEGAEDQSFVLKGSEDNGFIYAIAYKDGKFIGESYAGESDQGLRSYGSMTYTGFKSMLYANLSKHDPRVKGAWEWIGRYWRLDSNPNLPSQTSLQGLYYYYHVLSRALAAWGQDEVTDAKGNAHTWRNELIEALHERQKPDGSWNNEADRWMEGSPVLVTSYSLLALQEALAQ